MKKTYAAVSIILLIVFIGFTVSVKFIDVQPIGPNGSEVGFATLNSAVKKLIGTNEIADSVSDICITIAIGVAGFFALTGLIQLLKRKSFLKVDFYLYALAAFYIAVAIIYFFFMFFAINYRPLLDNNELEASYPSSHVLVTVGILMTALLQVRERIKNKTLKAVLQCGCVVISVLVVIVKLLAGVHWFTDIIGGILCAAMLISAYRLLNEYIREYQNKL